MGRRREQNNKYIVTMRDGSEVMLTASRLSEAHNIARKMGEAMTVQRVFKSATRVCQNVGGKVHSI